MMPSFGLHAQLFVGHYTSSWTDPLQVRNEMYCNAEGRPSQSAYYICSSRAQRKTWCGNPNIPSKKIDAPVTWACKSLLSDPAYVTTQIQQAISSSGHEEKETGVTHLRKSLDALQVKLRPP
jgi:hypothetical protein